MSLYSRLSLVLVFSFIATGVFAADPKAKAKPPADVAAEAFFALRDDKEALPTPERINKIMAAGITFLKTYPGHARANAVITSLATFGTTMKDKKQASQRVAYLSSLQYEILRQGGGDEKNKLAPTAMKALAAATAGTLAKEAPSRENFLDFRERIDRLAEMPEAGKFLTEQERAYIQLLKGMNNVAQAEKHAMKLVAGADKRAATMAQEELNIINIAKQPLELSFTAMDGRAVDVAQMRGKVVYFVFWATTNEASLNELKALKDVYAEYRREKFEIITVCYDKPEDKAAVEKFVKSNKITWPVWYTDTPAASEFGAKMNITKAPGFALFDVKGMYVSTGVRSAALGAQIKRLLGIK